MSSMILPSYHQENAYDMIEAAVMETSRGRWFLAEYARRNRHAETVTILEAIEHLTRKVDAGPSHRILGSQEAFASQTTETKALTSQTLDSSPSTQPSPPLQTELNHLAEVITSCQQKRQMIAAENDYILQGIISAEGEDQAVTLTERATGVTLEALNKIKVDLAVLRQHSAHQSQWQNIDNALREIVGACHLHALALQNIRALNESLEEIEARTRSLLGASSPQKPQEAAIQAPSATFSLATQVFVPKKPEAEKTQEEKKAAPSSPPASMGRMAGFSINLGSTPGARESQEAAIATKAIHFDVSLPEEEASRVAATPSPSTSKPIASTPNTSKVQPTKPVPLPSFEEVVEAELRKASLHMQAGDQADHPLNAVQKQFNGEMQGAVAEFSLDDLLPPPMPRNAPRTTPYDDLSTEDKIRAFR